MDQRGAARVGYFELIRRNRNFRRIWLGDVASLLGDWLNTIALYTVVERLTGSPLALGGVFLTKMLPFALASPLAGLLVDRLDRRRLMIVLDLLRAVLVLGYLWVDEASDLPLLYVLAASQMVLSAAFIPARSASIPNITSPGELLTANALMAATWSSLLALGAGLGGVLTAWLGADAVFLLDSLTYLVSAAFLWHTVIPQKTEENPGPLLATAWAGVMAGWSYVLRTPKVGRMAVVKPAWTVAGGGLVYMLTLLGPELMPAAPAMGMGFLFAARGLGTGIGPVVARSTLTNRHFWPLAFGLGIAASGLAYGSVGFLSWTFWLLPLVGFAHCFSGANWTFSTVLLQERAPDVYRGRVFATEWLLVTLMNSLSILAASLLLEYGYLTLRQGFFAFAAFMVAIGVLWLAVGAPAERRFMGAEEVG